MRRGFDYTLNSCGQQLEADTDEALFREGRMHMQTVHPDVQISDEDLRAAMAPRIYDVQERQAP